MTYHAPSMLSVDERFATDIGSARYAYSLEHLAEKTDDWWHGYMHRWRYAIGTATVSCNPLGHIKRFGGPDNYRLLLPMRDPTRLKASSDFAAMSLWKRNYANNAP